MTKLPEWIDVPDIAGDMGKLVPHLDLLVKYSAVWLDIGRKLTGKVDVPIRDSVALLSYLVDKADDAEVTAMLEEVGLGDLAAKLSDIEAEIFDEKKDWHKLLKQCADFSESYTQSNPSEDIWQIEDGDNAGRIALRLPNLVAAQGDKGSDSGFYVGIGGEVGIGCEAGAIWPFRKDNVPTGLFCMSLDGKANASARGALPIGQFGSFTGKAGAEGKVNLGYYFRPKRPGMIVAEALLESAPAIPMPHRLSQIVNAMTYNGLEGMVLSCDGRLESGIEVALGKDFDVPSIMSAKVGVSASLSLLRAANLILSIRRVATGRIDFALTRAIADEAGWGVGVGIDIDYAPLARLVHDRLVEIDGLASPMLARVKPFLSPGTYLLNEAAEKLQSTANLILNDEALREALVKDLSVLLGKSGDEQSAVAEVLQKKISDLAAKHSSAAFEDVKGWGNAIAGDLLSRLPAFVSDPLREALEQKIAPLLDSVKEEFEQTVQNLVTTSAGAKALKDELKKIGVAVSSGADDANKALKDVRKLVTVFEKFSKDLLEKTGESVQHKISTGFGWTGTQNRGHHYELMGSFVLTAPGADFNALEELWTKLAAGKLEIFQPMLADSTKQPAGFELNPSSALSRFGSKTSAFTFELAVLGFEVSIKTIVEGKARITTTMGGRITVTASSKAQREVDGFGEGRAAGFVSSWDLAMHKRDAKFGVQRAMTFALSLDHDDSDLSESEVKGLLEGLSKRGLIQNTRSEKAITLYQQWQQLAKPNKKVRGRIEIDMQLPPAGIERMLALGSALRRNTPAIERELFIKVAAFLLESGVSNHDRFERDCKEARREFKELAKVQDDWVVIYALRKMDLKPEKVGGYQGYRYAAFEQLIPRCLSFSAILRIMAEIYEAIPTGEAESGQQWTENDYINAEKRLAGEVKKWIRLNQSFIFWFKDGMHPALLAFFALLADIDQPLPSEGGPIDNDGAINVGTANNLFRVTMIRKPEKEEASAADAEDKQGELI